MSDATKRLWKVGAGLYAAWGLLHVVVGVIPLARFAASGPASMLSFFEFDLQTVDGPMLHASHVIAEHAAELIGFGLMAVTTVALVRERRRQPVSSSADVRSPRQAQSMTN